MSRTVLLRLVVALVCGVGGALVASAATSLALGPPSGATLLGAAALLGASMLADRFPVPLDHLDANGVSLGFVFSVSAVILFGWAPAVLVVAAAPLFMQLHERRPLQRVAYNASVHALAAGAGALAATRFDTSRDALLVAAIVACAVAQYVVNIGLVTLAAGIASRRPLADVVSRNVASTALPFALMASAGLMLVVLWDRSPVFSTALLGPLLAIALYQRSQHRELRALKLAFTDPLTGLGNHRDFNERLRREITNAARKDSALTLCVLDIDDFKEINDRHGHPAGDRVLASVGGRLRRDGEAFRLGGDEFAVLLPAAEGEDAALAAEAILERLRALEVDGTAQLTASIGLASFPNDAVSAEDVLRLADGALYLAKEQGKDRVQLYSAPPERAPQFVLSGV